MPRVLTSYSSDDFVKVVEGVAVPYEDGSPSAEDGWATGRGVHVESVFRSGGVESEDSIGYSTILGPADIYTYPL